MNCNVLWSVYNQLLITQLSCVNLQDNWISYIVVKLFTNFEQAFSSRYGLPIAHTCLIPYTLHCHLNWLHSGHFWQCVLVCMHAYMHNVSISMCVHTAITLNVPMHTNNSYNENKIITGSGKVHACMYGYMFKLIS